MGQAMAMMGRESGKKSSPLLLSSSADDGFEPTKKTISGSFLTRFWQKLWEAIFWQKLWEAIFRRFRGAGKPLSDPSVEDNNTNNALINPHCTVDIQIDGEIQRPVEQPHPEAKLVKEVQPRPPKQPSTGSRKCTKSKGSLGPYNWEQKILLVGDGDFSFSASLALAFGDDASNMIATSLNSFEFLVKNYAKAVANISELTSRSCKVMHGVDATRMARHPQLRSLKFDCVIYNFPHAGFSNKKDPRDAQISKHQSLVRGFLKNAKKMIKDEGQIHITHKCVGFFLDWNLEMLGESQGLQLVEESPFKCKLYPGYATKYGYGGDGNFDWKPAKTYKFQLGEALNQNKKKDTNK